MVKSISYFEEKSINIFEKLEENFYKDPKDIYSYITGITEELHNIGLMMIKESLEEMNQMLIDSEVRKSDWIIEKHSDKKLVTSLGTVSFKKLSLPIEKHRKAIIFWIRSWGCSLTKE